MTLPDDTPEALMLESLCLQDFAERLGETYLLAVGARRVPMILTEAKAVSDAPLGDATRIPFSLVFDTQEPGHLEQATYDVTLPSGETTQLFFVPIAKAAAGGVRLQAIFT